MSRIISIEYSQIIEEISNIYLSLSQYGSINKKKLTNNSHVKMGRLKAIDHVQELVHTKIITNLDAPLLVISVRNVMSNLRCIAYLKGKNDFACVSEEVIPSRPYQILGKRRGDNKLVIEELDTNIDNKLQYQWLLSGVPVLWDDMNQDNLYRKIVTAAADHSHVWRIYRGSNPNATPESIRTFEELQEIFLRTLNQNEEIAFDELNYYVQHKKLERENKYLHNIIGVDDSGSKLYHLIGIGLLEELGAKIKKMGAKRAICVDNSGSIEVQFYPKGINSDFIQEFAAPNNRPLGTAYLIIESVSYTHLTLPTIYSV